MDDNQSEKSPNRLIHEKSPYLLQHAYNPVDWYPWGAEAFKKAAEEDKPVFLSIGYSTCHWCHVMKDESFTDPEVAELLNETFISIKVDREERPDIDSIYMKVCQMMTGRGGWPLTILMAPNKKPFFAATYIPKEPRFGRVGIKELIRRVKNRWESQRQELVNTAEKVTSLLHQTEQRFKRTKKGVIDKSLLDVAYRTLSKQFDERHGGFGGSPKFPRPQILLFLLRYWKRTGKDRAIRMVEMTLREMRLGGIYDQVGFGFHRYSTDSSWLVPHFEKMLYDQAMLIMAYSEAYQAAPKHRYKQTVEEIISYLLRDMTDPGGGFYSAEDADSEGEEGKFYLWTVDEVRQILPVEESELVLTTFNLDEGGNFQDEATLKKSGKNILYLNESLEKIADKLEIPIVTLRERLEKARKRLFQAREKRVHPKKDDKILTDWNGLIIAALARAAQVFDSEDYFRAAKCAANFIVEHLRASGGRLYHRYRDGNCAIEAFIDDYAFLIWGLLELYEASLEVEYLELANELNEEMLTHFWDDENGGFYFTSKDAEDTLVRAKKVRDGVYPSGNSVALMNLLRLARMTSNPDWEGKASEMLETFSGEISKSPTAYTYLLAGMDFALGPSYEVVVVGNLQDTKTQELLRLLRVNFIPNKVVLFRPLGEKSPRISKVADFTRNFSGQEGEATVYVCSDYSCHAPTSDPEEMLDLLSVE
ncbi:MAG: thioredoxin domain-containing protein [Thermoproteota archaeon]